MSNFTEHHGSEIYAKLAEVNHPDVVTGTVMMLEEWLDDVTMVVTDEGTDKVEFTFKHEKFQITVRPLVQPFS